MNFMNNEKPELIESREAFRGKVFRVTVDTVREHGTEVVRDIVRHPGSACIVALDENDEVILVRQYRHPAEKFLLEIPAGSRHDEHEEPEKCAHRELEEELGFVAGKLKLLAEFYVSPGFVSEKMWIYLATDLRETQQNLDDDEHIEIVRVSLGEALRMIERGEIEDAKTIIGLKLTAQRASKNSQSEAR